jgi:hypothetical protein
MLCEKMNALERKFYISAPVEDEYWDHSYGINAVVEAESEPTSPTMKILGSTPSIVSKCAFIECSGPARILETTCDYLRLVHKLQPERPLPQGWKHEFTQIFQETVVKEEFPAILPKQDSQIDEATPVLIRLDRVLKNHPSVFANLVDQCMISASACPQSTTLHPESIPILKQFGLLTIGAEIRAEVRELILSVYALENRNLRMQVLLEMDGASTKEPPASPKKVEIEAPPSAMVLLKNGASASEIIVQNTMDKLARLYLEILYMLVLKCRGEVVEFDVSDLSSLQKMGLLQADTSVTPHVQDILLSSAVGDYCDGNFKLISPLALPPKDQ